MPYWKPTNDRELAEAEDKFLKYQIELDEGEERIAMARNELVDRYTRVHAIALQHGRRSKEYHQALSSELWQAASTGIAFYPGVAKRLHFGLSREREYPMQHSLLVIPWGWQKHWKR